MASISDSNYASTKTYDDGTFLDEADLDTSFSYIQTYINARKNDLVKLANDAYGSSYNLDGTAQTPYDYSLYDKFRSSSILNIGSDISIGTSTDASFSNVSTSFITVSATPQVAGYHKIAFNFSHIITLNSASEGECVTAWRISDGGSLLSANVVSGGAYPARSASSVKIYVPVHVELIANLPAGSATTFYLQKRNIAATNVSANQVGASTTTGEVAISIEKI